MDILESKLQHVTGDLDMTDYTETCLYRHEICTTQEGPIFSWRSGIPRVRLGGYTAGLRFLLRAAGSLLITCCGPLHHV